MSRGGVSNTRQRFIDHFQHEIRVSLMNAHRRLDAQRVAEEPALADEQTQLQLQIEQELWADAYGTTVFQFPGLLVWSDQVTGVTDNPLSPNYFWNFWEWTPVEEG